MERVMRRTANRDQLQAVCRADTEHLLVLGGPGVGKTHFVKRFIQELDSIGCSLVSLAFTGVAACNIPGGRTIHSVCNIPIQASAATRLTPFSTEQAYVLRTYLQNCSFILIDEISMVSAALLGMMHERPQQVMDSELPF
jgi:MoxR-like ATPase